LELLESEKQMCSLISKYSPEYVRSRALESPGNALAVLVSSACVSEEQTCRLTGGGRHSHSGCRPVTMQAADDWRASAASLALADSHLSLPAPDANTSHHHTTHNHQGRVLNITFSLGSYFACLAFDRLAGTEDDLSVVRRRAQQLRETLTHLGPSFIKAGQVSLCVVGTSDTAGAATCLLS
jgi:hypothetical protein